MTKMRIEFDLDDDLDVLPPAGFERVYKGQKRFDDNANLHKNEKKRSGNRVKRIDKEDFDKEDL